MIATELLLHEEFVGKLPQRVDGIESDVQVVVLSHIIEVLTQILPDLLPHEADSAHVEIGHLHQLL